MAANYANARIEPVVRNDETPPRPKGDPDVTMSTARVARDGVDSLDCRHSSLMAIMHRWHGYWMKHSEPSQLSYIPMHVLANFFEPKKTAELHYFVDQCESGIVSEQVKYDSSEVLSSPLDVVNCFEREAPECFKRRVIVLSGVPHIGKSRFCHQLLLEVLQDQPRPNASLTPILCVINQTNRPNFSQLKDSNVLEQLSQLLAAQLKTANLLPGNFDKIWSEFESAHPNGKNTLLLLDIDWHDLTTAEQEETDYFVSAAVQGLPDCFHIITTRPEFVTTERAERMQVMPKVYLDILGFTKESITEQVSKCLPKSNPDNCTKYSLLGMCLNRFPFLQSLCRLPNIFFTLCNMNWEGEVLGTPALAKIFSKIGLPKLDQPDELLQLLLLGTEAFNDLEKSDLVKGPSMYMEAPWKDFSKCKAFLCHDVARDRRLGGLPHFYFFQNALIRDFFAAFHVAVVMTEVCGSAPAENLRIKNLASKILHAFGSGSPNLNRFLLLVSALLIGREEAHKAFMTAVLKEIMDVCSSQDSLNVTVRPISLGHSVHCLYEANNLSLLPEILRLFCPSSNLPSVGCFDMVIPVHSQYDSIMLHNLLNSASNQFLQCDMIKPSIELQFSNTFRFHSKSDVHTKSISAADLLKFGPGPVIISFAQPCDKSEEIAEFWKDFQKLFHFFASDERQTCECIVFKLTQPPLSVVESLCGMNSPQVTLELQEELDVDQATQTETEQVSSMPAALEVTLKSSKMIALTSEKLRLTTTALNLQMTLTPSEWMKSLTFSDFKRLKKLSITDMRFATSRPQSEAGHNIEDHEGYRNESISDRRILDLNFSDSLNLPGTLKSIDVSISDNLQNLEAKRLVKALFERLLSHSPSNLETFKFSCSAPFYDSADVAESSSLLSGPLALGGRECLLSLNLTPQQWLGVFAAFTSETNHTSVSSLCRFGINFVAASGPLSVAEHGRVSRAWSTWKCDKVELTVYKWNRTPAEAEFLKSILRGVAWNSSVREFTLHFFFLEDSNLFRLFLGPKDYLTSRCALTRFVRRHRTWHRMWTTLQLLGIRSRAPMQSSDSTDRTPVHSASPSPDHQMPMTTADTLY